MTEGPTTGETRTETGESRQGGGPREAGARAGGEARREQITLGGGCFWCIEAVFQEVEGVHEVVSGYAGGQVPDPTYRQVCSGGTGHAEVVRVTFDPDVIPLDEILRIFFAVHDPTTKDRQGADVGTQYRSIVLHHHPSQEPVVRRIMDEVESSGTWGAPLVTEVDRLTVFYPAEAGHQNYYRSNPYQPYCRVVIDPKVAKLRRAFRDRLKADAG